MHLSFLSELLGPVLKQNFYLDPGSGSFILQVLIASFAGIMYALRGYWMKFFKRGKKDDSGAEEDIFSDDD